MRLEDKIRQLIEEKIADRPDLFIVDIKVINNAKVIILLDGDQGLGIDDCAAVSRHVGYHLEEENLIDHAYNLEVSSPGLDAPLVLERQFLKNLDRNVSLKLKDGKKLDGKLISSTSEKLVIEHKVKEKGKKAQLVQTELEKSNIAETKISVSFK